MLDRKSQPSVEPLCYTPLPQYRTGYLDNGIEVTMIQFGNVPVLEVQIVLKTGYCYEKKNGAAPTAFRLLTDGTKEKTSSQIAEFLDGYGSEISTEVGFEQSSVVLSTVSKHILKTLPILAETFFHASYPENEFQNYQTRTIERLAVDEKKTAVMAGRLFAQKVFGKHPYGKRISGLDMQNLNYQDVLDFYQNEIQRSQINIIVAGNYDENEVFHLLNQYFGKISQNTSSKISNSLLIPAESQVGTHIHRMEGQVQTSLRMGHLSIPRSHQDYDELQVVGCLLGGFFGSRLMKNIREDKGYTYGIYADFVGMKENGYFVISTDVANKFVESTLSEIQKEIHKLQNELVPEAELNVVKNYMLGLMISRMETPFQISELLSSMKLHGLSPEDLEKEFYTIQNISSQRILELSNQYYRPSEMVIALAGTLNVNEL